MLNETSKILFDTEKNNILEVVKVFNGNFGEFASHINENETALKELTEVVDWQRDSISSLWDQIGRLSRKKAGKFGLVLMAAAGIAYIVKNEYDKSVMKNKLIQLDKDARGCEQFSYTPQEDEGEAEEPIGI